MKFEYDGNADGRKVIAVMTEQGNLMFSGPNGKRVTICSNGNTHAVGSDLGIEPVKKFYPGDKITITF